MSTAFNSKTEFLVPLLTPRGYLVATLASDAAPFPSDLQDALLTSFEQGAGTALLHLGSREATRVLPPTWAWWRDFAVHYVTALCALPEGELIAIATPDQSLLEAWILDVPPMQGAQYLSAAVLAEHWQAMDASLRNQLSASGLSRQAFLKARNPAWQTVGRVHFNLAENRKDAECPFAFVATYTTSLSVHGKAQHQPLSRAMTEFSKSKSQLLSLLVPVKNACAQCSWLAEMVEAGDVYHPLAWTVQQAHQFLIDAPKLEAAGIIVRAPSSWKAGRPARPKVQAQVGSGAASLLGVAALIDFKVEVTLEGEAISASELAALLAGSDGLQWLKGRWIEVDKKAIQRLLMRFESLEKKISQPGEGLDMAQALRLVAGASKDGEALDAPNSADATWSEISAGPWLAGVLQTLRHPEGLAPVEPGDALKATLRPYQQAGLRWLYLLSKLGLGACLADDMGLGKTIQVLSLLLVLKRESTSNAPCLLVAPASLLSNWASEAERFVPSLRVLLAHSSSLPNENLNLLHAEQLHRFDLVITSYGTLVKLPLLMQMTWRIAVLDEAQAIKNPNAQQTAQVKKLLAGTRIALTGTPVENRLSDLWSIFDFTHPGLLGTGKEFANFTKQLAATEHYGPLRTLVQPYILRRMKTDKQVISDLPDKTELKAWCHLSPLQAAHYESAVAALARALEEVEGIARKGLVLSYLMRFKQICNHPSQWLGDAAFKPDDSGKFERLRELAEVIASKQEKLLVFTQFREMTEPLAAFLGGIFGTPGLVLHGGTPVAKRRALVQRFQDDELTPFFVLSLKAGGAGLNLTAASHVIHFDRWWNPAVENQATDRAFRIGQKRNVLVHKFVCKGTVEERIDQLIESKQALVESVLEGDSQLQLTELSDAQLLALVRLDIHSATGG